MEKGIVAAAALLSLLLLPVLSSTAQPVAISQLPIGSKLVYRLSGVYIGNKTYEVTGWSSSEGRRCKLVRVHLEVNASGSLFYRGINSTSEFCYDDRGRPLSEMLLVPPEFNLSVRRVLITYWWEDNEVFPYRTVMRLEDGKNESYEILLKQGIVVKESGGRKERIRFTGDNLSRALPFVPERLSEPYIDLSSLRLKEGYEKSFGSTRVRVISLENVRTPAGLFPCYKVIISGRTEDYLPMNSTVYVTVREPRFTVYYVTDIIGIEQVGYVTEVTIPSVSANWRTIQLPLLAGVAVAVLAFFLIKRTAARKRKGE